MKKTAFNALLIAILVPFIGFLIVHYFSKDALRMPPRFYYDTVVSTVHSGKQIQDTLWHSVKDFHLVNQLGDSVSWKRMQGKIVVLDFFFTSCRSFCPRLSKHMYLLQEALSKTPDMVQLLSFSVDPDTDKVPVLKRYADKYQAKHDRWWLLTGDKKTIYDLGQEELHVGITEDEKDDFIHTDRFILLDKNRVVRGYYSGQDSLDMLRLLNDIAHLHMEKVPKGKISKS